MKKPPKLTDTQKRRLKILEPALRTAVETGNLSRANLLTCDIQELLRPTGHEARLMRAKNWLFEAEMEAGNIEYAISGFESVRQTVTPTSRLYLEATALLAVCHLRKGALEKAQPLVDNALASLQNIKSDSQRRKFRANLVKRFEEEGMLAALSETEFDQPNIEELHRDAMKIAETKTEEEIIILLGQSTPQSVVQYLQRVSDLTNKQLPYRAVLLLPSHETKKEHLKLGEKVFYSLRRVVWRSLCDPESEVYKLWFTTGMKVLFDKKYLTTAIVAALAGYRVGVYGIAVYCTALILKVGLEVYCDVCKPKPIMGSRDA